MIQSKDISIVVQGAINKIETEKCLKSIKKFLPDAQVILSTWEGSDVSFLEGLYDILILNKDPGAGYYYETESDVKYNNLNRQLVSTQNGLKKASRTYAMKIRSDIIFNSDKFLSFFDSFPVRNPQFSLFNHKILTSAAYSKFLHNDFIGKNFTDFKLLFHISDWWFFGLKEDLQMYFDVPLVKEPEFSNYYNLEENKNKFNPFNMAVCYLQFPPEQYFAVKCFEKHVEKHVENLNIEHSGDTSDEKFEQARQYIINNFIFLEYSDSGIYFNKYILAKYPWLSSVYIDLYNKYRQKYEYKKYCDNNYNISNFAKYIVNIQDKSNIWNFYIYFHKIHRSKNVFKIIYSIAAAGIFFVFCLLQFLIYCICETFKTLLLGNNRV